MKESSQAAARCPLCEGDNRCAIAAGQPAENCWCQSVEISATARMQAASSAGKRCLCPACGAPTNEFVKAITGVANAG
jgi:hypothetical protein